MTQLHCLSLLPGLNEPPFMRTKDSHSFEDVEYDAKLKPSMASRALMNDADGMKREVLAMHHAHAAFKGIWCNK